MGESVQVAPVQFIPSAQRIQVSPVFICVIVPSPLSLKSVVGVVGADDAGVAAKVVIVTGALCAEQLPTASHAATL